MDVLREALRRIRDGGAPALVTVVRASGSTPRHAGAHMLVDADGATFATIGGGRVEKELTDLGAKVARGEAPAQRAVFHLVRDLAMCCGGTMECWIEPAAAAVDALAQAVDCRDRREPAVLVTSLSGAGKALRAGAPGSPAPRLEGDDFCEPILPRERVILFGLGHVSRALGPLCASVGFQVVVCDDNETGQLESPPAWVDQAVASFELADVEAALGGLGARDFALILTRDHAVDERILTALLPRAGELAYLGLIGSRGKIGRFRKRLSARGVATPEDWQRLRAPIGLDIAAETPAEIAVSVVAELIAVRNGAREGAA